MKGVLELALQQRELPALAPSLTGSLKNVHGPLFQNVARAWRVAMRTKDTRTATQRRRNSGAGSLIRWAGRGGSRANVINQSGPGGVRQPRWATAGRLRGKGLGGRRFPASCGGRRQHRFGPMSDVLEASLVCIGHPLCVWAITRSPPRGVCDAPHPQRGLVPSRHQGEPAGEAGRRSSLRPEIHYFAAAV